MSTVIISREEYDLLKSIARTAAEYAHASEHKLPESTETFRRLLLELLGRRCSFICKTCDVFMCPMKRIYGGP